MHTAPQSADMQTASFLGGSSPDYMVQLRSYFDLRPRLTWDTSTYYVDKLKHQGPLSNVTIPSYARLDSGLTWKLGEGVSVSIIGQNLLKDHHLEFEDMNGSLQSGQIKRSGYIKLTWRF
jgi:outer membrane receptor for monomeric catechols